MHKAALIALLLVLLEPQPDARQGAAGDRASGISGVTLVPTDHPPLPRDVAHLWFAPAGGRPAGRPASARDLTAAVTLAAEGDDERALAILSQPSLQQGTLGTYALYFAGLSQLRLGRLAQARDTFRLVQSQSPVGYLNEAAAAAEAEAHEALGDPDAAVLIYEKLVRSKTAAPDEMLMRLGSAAKAAGERGRAAEAFARVFYEFPLSDLASIADAELEGLNRQRLAPGNQRYKLELGRAERLFGARRYVPARTAFQALRPVTSGDDRELVDLRLAECEYYLKRPRTARSGVEPYIRRASRQGEALYFYAISLRELGNHAEYVKTARRIADEFTTQSWAEEALNNLATHYILVDDEAKADAAFRELYAKYPQSRYSERAAWKIGWRAYREERYEETVRVFEQASAGFPRSDYRPSWLYWSARGYEALKDRPRATERDALLAADYLNSYYGRLVVKSQNGRTVPARVVAGSPAALVPPPPNERIVRALLALRLYDQADAELRYAQRTWGDSPAIQATRAWISREQGQAESGPERFTLLRGAITAMRRAYPQFLAAGGEDLPREILTVIYPMAYWDLIRKHAGARALDPFLVAALVAQESTFVPDVRSSANAVGLMQLLPSTARQYARNVGLRYSAALLRDPEANIRMGTAYFADKIREFGDVHLALASYNAGERAVRTWLAERPGVPREEFIDDIPYAETQNYVKRILGTAEDYRRLYGDRD